MSDLESEYEKAKKRMDEWQAKTRKSLKRRLWLFWVLFTLNTCGAAQDFGHHDWGFGACSLIGVLFCASGILDTGRLLKQKFIERE